MGTLQGCLAHKINIEFAAVSAMFRNKILQRCAILKQADARQEERGTFRGQVEQFRIGAIECNRFYGAERPGDD